MLYIRLVVELVGQDESILQTELVIVLYNFQPFFKIR